jgi:hypothetical protein
MRNRRADDRERYLHFDRFPATTFILVLALLILTLADGILTLVLLEERYFEEANPVMRALIARGPTTFVVGKYLLTVFGLPFLLIFAQHRIFLPRLRVGHVLPTAVVLYVVLLIYQIGLIYTL